MTRKDLQASAKKAASTTGQDIRTGMDSAAIKQAIVDHLHYSVGCLPAVATANDYYRALALTVRDRLQRAAAA